MGKVFIDRVCDESRSARGWWLEREAGRRERVTLPGRGENLVLLGDWFVFAADVGLRMGMSQ